MDFTFNEDQLLFQSTLRDFLAGECTPEMIRACWEAGTSHSPELWAKLAELGVPGLLVPEAHEGMGMCEIDSVLLFEEAGRAALPEPVVSTGAVAAPLLVELGEKSFVVHVCLLSTPSRTHSRCCSLAARRSSNSRAASSASVSTFL